MNKKVLSAILFSALFAGTGTFTSCIDTDEPAGIEELRGAKAELLRAKVSVEQAQASLLLAQAEVEKAKAAKQLADAEISEALAAIAQAKADSINVSNDADREALKMTIAQNQMKLEALQAKHQTIMNNLNSALAQSQRSYEIMLAQIEIAKAVGSSENFVTISELQRKVRRAQSKVNAAQADVKDAQKKYDFAVAYDETHAELNAKTLEAWVAAAEDSLVEAQAVLAKWEGYLASAENADWAKEIKALDDSLAAIKKDTVELNLAIAKALNSDSLVALVNDTVEAAKPATAGAVYGHKYFGAEYATTLHLENNATVLKACDVTEEAAKKAVINENTLKLIAEYDEAGTLKEGNQLYADKKYLASFTEEYKYWLDSIAVNDSVYMAGIKAASDTAIVMWERALAAYKAADLTIDAKRKAAEDSINGKTFTKPADVKNAAKALLDYLTVAKKNGAVLNQVLTLTDSISVPKEIKDGKVVYENKPAYSLQDPLEVLKSETKTFVAINEFDVDFLLATATSDTITVMDKATEKNKKFTYNKNVIKTAAPAVGEIGEFGNSETLLGKLQLASKDAFGFSSQYVDSQVLVDNEIVTGRYLHKKPTAADAKYVGYANAGKYGFYLASLDTELQFVAKNYKSIMADLETAIAYWEATYNTLNAKYIAWAEAKKAAKDAYDNHETNVIKPMEDKIAALAAKAGRIVEIKGALCEALAAYLPEEWKELDGSEYDEDNTPQENLQAFVEFLNEEIAAAKDEVVAKEYALANAQMWATLIENGEGIVEKAQAELDEAIANLEAKQAKLDEALANLAKGLEIIAAVNAAE